MVEHRYSDLFLTAREALRPTQGENAANCARELLAAAAGAFAETGEGPRDQPPALLRKAKRIDWNQWTLHGHGPKPPASDDTSMSDGDAACGVSLQPSSLLCGRPATCSSP